MKVKELISILKKLPLERELQFECDGRYACFNRVESLEAIDFYTCDDNGNELRNPKIEVQEPQTKITFDF